MASVADSMPVEFEQGTAMTAAELCRSKCVEFDDLGMILTATRGGEAVAEVVLKDDGAGGGVLRVLPSESFLDGGHRVHVVDVQGEREAFVLVVEVQEHDGSIASVRKIC
ncbi:hypothetical protein CFC21_097689 [Triticum aestivum]|uniref:Uncharacterized protein n=2 Tax=Triticum aestivum TaxID=4565 RepID=A0A3B6RF47_WHEAT|nr:hypothetical protein CFC21_097689 [Triticum aestivum]